jgi:putative Holliday junction resolvase
MMRILAIDPGEKRLGVALSDPSGTIANPLSVLKHVSRAIDAASIAQLAMDHGAERIIIGQALDEENQPTPQSRRAYRLASAIRLRTRIPVELWDESGSTQAAQAARIAMGVSRRKRSGHMDDIAATYILQTYLDERDEASKGQPHPASPADG